MAIIKKSKTTNTGDDVERRERSYTAVGNVNCYSCYGEQYAAAAKSLQSDSVGPNLQCLTVRPHRRQPTRLPRPWDFPGKSTGVGCHCLLWNLIQMTIVSTTVGKNPLGEMK